MAEQLMHVPSLWKAWSSNLGLAKSYTELPPLQHLCK